MNQLNPRVSISPTVEEILFSQFILFWFLWTKTSMYYIYAGGPNFSYFTTVIVMNFEADYLLNRWTYRNTGVAFIIFDLQQLLLLAKLIRPTVREIANLQKADKFILCQTVLGLRLTI
jgi:hypothetical protein